MSDPKGYGLASVEETLDAFSTVVMKLEDCLAAEDMDDLSIYKVRRIDVARDFHGVQSPSATIRGLAPLHRNHSKKCVLYTKSSSNYAETLEVGAESSGYVRLYDKHAQSKGAVEPGTLRWEVEAHKPWAKKCGGLETLEDLAEIGVDDLARNRWDWSSMGAEVASVGGVVRAAVKGRFTDLEVTTFLGWLVRQGTPDPSSLASATLSKYRKYQRELGITVADGVWSAPVVSTRLDWETGEEVAHAINDPQPCENE